MKRYRAASIFVDHFSRLHYVHLMQDLSSNETVKAKLAFEHFAAEHGVAIKHYHCDNGSLWTMRSSCRASKHGSNSPSVGSMPISRMELRSALSETCRRARESSCCTRASTGQRQCTWPCGHTLSVVPPSFTTVCRRWRMGRRDRSYSAQSEWVLRWLTTTLLPAPCLHCKTNSQLATLCLSGPQGQDWVLIWGQV